MGGKKKKANGMGKGLDGRLDRQRETRLRGRRENIGGAVILGSGGGIVSPNFLNLRLRRTGSIIDGEHGGRSMEYDVQYTSGKERRAGTWYWGGVWEPLRTWWYPIHTQPPLLPATVCTSE
jgi:hypothetical protein